RHRRGPAPSSCRGRDDDWRGDDVAHGDRSGAVGGDPPGGREVLDGSAIVKVDRGAITWRGAAKRGAMRTCQGPERSRFGSDRPTSASVGPVARNPDFRATKGTDGFMLSFGLVGAKTRPHVPQRAAVQVCAFCPEKRTLPSGRPAPPFTHHGLET